MIINSFQWTQVHCQAVALLCSLRVAFPLERSSRRQQLQHRAPPDVEYSTKKSRQRSNICFSRSTISFWLNYANNSWERDRKTSSAHRLACTHGLLVLLILMCLCIVLFIATVRMFNTEGFVYFFNGFVIFSHLPHANSSRLDEAHTDREWRVWKTIFFLL